MNGLSIFQIIEIIGWAIAAAAAAGAAGGDWKAMAGAAIAAVVAHLRGLIQIPTIGKHAAKVAQALAEHDAKQMAPAADSNVFGTK